MEGTRPGGRTLRSRDIPRTSSAPGRRAVRTRGLVKRFGSTVALAGLDLDVPEGAVYVLVGANGAGKTTTLRILLDLLRPDRGEAAVLGLDPREEGARIRAGIGYVPEGRETGYGWMRVSRLLAFHAAYFPAWDEEYAARLSGALELRLDRPFGELSKGQARRVQLVMALSHRPPLLMLDEPTDGLDPVARDRVLGLVAEHLEETPTTVLLSTHLVHEAERLADHLGVMTDGRLEIQVPRSGLRERLRRYHLRLPEVWSSDPETELPVVAGERSGRDLRWLVWGSEEEVVAALEAAGASVEQVSAVTLEEAAVALLGRRPVGAGEIPGA